MANSSSDKLVRAINDSAQQVGAATLTFLAVCVYIGIAVASTKDKVLLLETTFGLPLFNVQIPLDEFYILAPALMTFLHLYVLLLQYLLLCKIVRYCKDDNPPEEETDLFFPSLPLSVLLGKRHPGMVRFLLWLLLIMITAVLPVCLLISTQVKFLPHHSPSITAWHKFLVLFDLALIWYFTRRAPVLEPEERTVMEGSKGNAVTETERRESADPDTVASPRARLEFHLLKNLGLVGGIFLTLVAAAFSTLVAGGPGIGYEFRTGRATAPFAKVLAENLSLKEQVLVEGDIPDEKDISPLHPRGAQLRERDLQDADFTGAILINADFRGANLSRAVFDGADLRRATFAPAEGAAGMLELMSRGPSAELLARERMRILGHGTALRGASLRGVDLRKANLFMADLRGANLEGAKLDGADLTLADLRGAILRKALMNGARLSHAILNRADLRMTELRGADLSAAKLLGADLWRGKLFGANFSRADLRGAKLVEATAIAADFSSANAIGADFEHASLGWAKGLALRGVDLRGADLAGLAACSGGETARALNSDLRSVRFEGLAHAPWSEQFRSPTCLVDPAFDPSGLLYDKVRSEPLARWPAPRFSEREYHRRLAKMLVDEACRDHELAEVLLREIAGESVPWRSLLSLEVAYQIDRRREECPAFRFLSVAQKDAIERAKQEDPLRSDT